MIRLLIADDHPLVRNALTQLLGTVEDIEVVATTANGREAVTMALETSPDVVLMDLEMPELNGIEATRELIAADPSARVVILTTFSDRENIMGALDAGALGYLLKDAEPEEIIRGVRSAARGWVARTEKDGWVLAQDAESIRLADLYHEFVFNSDAVGVAESDLGLSLREYAARGKG